MAITYPLDFLDIFPGWSTEFELLWRQEQSRQANGVTRAKDLGSPLWKTSYVTRSLSPNLLDEWRARLDVMENGIQQFRGWPLSRCRPIKHPGSSALPVGSIATINANRKAISVSGLAGVSLSIGDMIRVGGRDLHRVQEPATGTPTNQFEIRPHLWPAADVGQAVNIVKPYTLMTIVPGSISSTADLQTGRGSVSFQAIESR
ncbi:hypothetical protein G6N74_28440 [Mesorhizobium sp. CGMCC 1.15528]|uniref:Uncharacterized protein n=1 Tax=Mesorhizobium zhangyense TaxID=1776730 RepID=A0A7C9VHV9_9HYPH|nr:hypothetical protein [Mesorhizobium zhangyense]NGN44990.1 hypothetical protein [Mesorhizobium zhangyense]